VRPRVPRTLQGELIFFLGIFFSSFFCFSLLSRALSCWSQHVPFLVCHVAELRVSVWVFDALFCDHESRRTKVKSVPYTVFAPDTDEHKDGKQGRSIFPLGPHPLRLFSPFLPFFFRVDGSRQPGESHFVLNLAFLLS